MSSAATTGKLYDINLAPITFFICIGPCYKCGFDTREMVIHPRGKTPEEYDAQKGSASMCEQYLICTECWESFLKKKPEKKKAIEPEPQHFPQCGCPIVSSLFK